MIGEEPHSSNYVLIPVAVMKPVACTTSITTVSNSAAMPTARPIHPRPAGSGASRSLAYATTFMCFVEEGGPGAVACERAADNRGNHISRGVKGQDRRVLSAFLAEEESGAERRAH